MSGRPRRSRSRPSPDAGGYPPALTFERLPPGFQDLIFRYFGDELLLLDSRGRIVFANDAAARRLGRSTSGLLGRPITDFFTEPISPRRWRRTYFLPIKRRGEPVSYVLERRGVKGRRGVVDVTAVHLTYEGREYLLSIGRDVSRQSAQRRSLEETVGMYRSLCEAAADPILFLDREGRILFLNGAGLRALRRSLRRLVGRDFCGFLSPDRRIEAERALRRVASGRGLCRFESVLRIGRGDLPVECTASAVEREGGICGIYVMLRDLRSQKECERLAREAEKIRSLQSFLTGSARELKHPLQGVLRRIDRLLATYRRREFEYIGYREFQDIFQTIATLRDRIRYCHDMVGRLIDLGRKRGAVPRRGADVASSVTGALKSVATQCALNKVVVRKRVPSRLPEVRMDPLDFRQVLENLVTNAVQAMPAGGTLTVRARSAEDGHVVDLIVQDEGIGISPEDLPNIFEPFYTTKERGVYKSSGLGLSIAHHLIRSAGGDLAISSSLRKGTVVRLRVPTWKGERKGRGPRGA